MCVVKFDDESRRSFKMDLFFPRGGNDCHSGTYDDEDGERIPSSEKKEKKPAVNEGGEDHQNTQLYDEEKGEVILPVSVIPSRMMMPPSDAYDFKQVSFGTTPREPMGARTVRKGGKTYKTTKHKFD
ncbi:MAG: hypothetical protein AAB355_03310 [Patescibacteria group bacterium]